MPKIAYYIGAGVFNHGGKDYRFGEALPGGLQVERVAALVKRGKASHTAPAGGAPAMDVSEALCAKVRELTAARDQASEAASVEVGRLQERVGMLEKASLEREELLATVTGERDAARDTIREMSKAALAPPAPPAPPAAPLQGAGPKK